MSCPVEAYGLSSVGSATANLVAYLEWFDCPSSFASYYATGVPLGTLNDTKKFGADEGVHDKTLSKVVYLSIKSRV